LLTRETWLTNGQFRFRVTGTSGESYVLQDSTNLGAWTPLLTNSPRFTTSLSQPRPIMTFGFIAPFSRLDMPRQRRGAVYCELSSGFFKARATAC